MYSGQCCLTVFAEVVDSLLQAPFKNYFDKCWA